MTKYFFESNGVKVEVSESLFASTLDEYYDVGNMTSTGNGDDYDEITLHVQEIDMPHQ